MSAPPLRIGLTGGIGSGKSTAATAFAARGARVIDADAIAREMTQPGGAAIASLRAAFGDAAIDAQGALDRPSMRERAFLDPSVRRQLEAILHPLIEQRAAREAALSSAPLIVYDIPLLSSASQWRRHAHRILVIDCSPATQIERVLRRPGWTLDTAQRVVAAQSDRSARRALADAVIHNDDACTLAELDAAVDTLLQFWKHPLLNAVEQ